MNLPEEFLAEMKKILEDEYPAFLASYDMPACHGLRINTRKITGAEFEAISPFSLQPVEWIENGYYIEEKAPAKDPYYFAGLYYLQEASAMTPANVLAPEPGDRVLDLCAAPGGKATELGARLKGEGLLLANDISNSRAKALLKNLELFGIPNIYVTSENPSKLCQFFPGYFDRILVDAPCSGEGMFRRESGMIADWLQKGPDYYQAIQKELILQAADMLRPGGRLLYSTCTFSEKEDEEVIRWLLAQRSDMHLIPIKEYAAFSHGKGECSDCVRIFPHKMRGEGHFLALVQRDEANIQMDEPDFGKKVRSQNRGGRTGSKIPPEAEAFLQMCKGFFQEKKYQMVIKEDRLYALGEEDWMPEKLRYLRSGLYVGDCKKNRFEPSQAMAMVLKSEQYPYILRLDRADERVIRYLKGETISISDFSFPDSADWILVTVDGYPLGWGKCAGSVLKNKYYAGWRWQ